LRYTLGATPMRLRASLIALCAMLAAPVRAQGEETMRWGAMLLRAAVVTALRP
jgi:hypothetical protein